MLERLRQKASEVAWRAQWRAVRAAATPWVRNELASARKKLAGVQRETVVERDHIDRWIADAAPPDVPYEAVLLRGAELAQRFPDGPRERRTRHLIGKLRMTHRAIPSVSVI